MALELVWTKRAEQGYDRIIKYLEKNWTEKEIKSFLQESNPQQAQTFKTKEQAQVSACAFLRFTGKTVSSSLKFG